MLSGDIEKIKALIKSGELVAEINRNPGFHKMVDNWVRHNLPKKKVQFTDSATGEIKERWEPDRSKITDNAALADAVKTLIKGGKL